MSKIYMGNRLPKEKRDLIKNLIVSFFDGYENVIFEGSVEFKPNIEERTQGEPDEIEACITSYHLRIDVVKTNPKLLHNMGW